MEIQNNHFCVGTGKMKLEWMVAPSPVGTERTQHAFEFFWWDEMNIQIAINLLLFFVIVVAVVVVEIMIWHLPVQDSRFTKNAIKIMSQWRVGSAHSPSTLSHRFFGDHLINSWSPLLNRKLRERKLKGMFCSFYRLNGRVQGRNK